MLCLKKFKEGGIENALFDAPGRGRNAEITDEEKAWIINIACQKPIDFGYAAETWTYAKLTSHINKTAEAAGYTRLSTIHKSTVNTILAEADIKPHKITYYCENRDPDFDSKMHNVLLVYKQLEMQFDESGKLIVSDDTPVHVEGFFSKMTRQMLRGIRVKSKDELTDRIYKYFAEINEEPIVFHWKYNLDDIDVSEEIIVDTLPVKKVELIKG